MFLFETPLGFFFQARPLCSAFIGPKRWTASKHIWFWAIWSLRFLGNWKHKVQKEKTWLHIGPVEQPFYLLRLSGTVFNKDPGDIGNVVEGLGQPGEVGHLGGAGEGWGDHVQHRKAHVQWCVQPLWGLFLQTRWYADPKNCVNNHDDSNKFEGVCCEQWHVGFCLKTTILPGKLGNWSSLHLFCLTATLRKNKRLNAMRVIKKNNISSTVVEKCF